MTYAIDQLAIYLHLANAAWKKLQMPDRDRLFMLSAAVASHMNLFKISAYCRYLILKNNPGHMIGKWPTVEAAMHDEDYVHFLRQVHRRFPLEKAEVMLDELGIDRANERDAYYNDFEYAASLLGVNIHWLNERF